MPLNVESVPSVGVRVNLNASGEAYVEVRRAGRYNMFANPASAAINAGDAFYSRVIDRNDTVLLNGLWQVHGGTAFAASPAVGSVTVAGVSLGTLAARLAPQGRYKGSGTGAVDAISGQYFELEESL
jgi:hypothetical protein